MSRWAVVLGALLCSAAHAQMPDVRVKFDMLYAMGAQKDGAPVARFYDREGNRALLNVTLIMETGIRAYLSQRLQQIANDPDQDPFEEYYLEDPGLWRLGKQMLPFGPKHLIRESAFGAVGETGLALEGIPIVVGLFDGGAGKQRGVVGRIGSRLGLSFAVGDHFGIGASSLNMVRQPEDSPGLSAGFRQLYGLDYSKSFGHGTLSGELLFMRDSNLASDQNDTLYDVSFAIGPPKLPVATIGLSRSMALSKSFLRTEGLIKVNKNLWVRPLIRLADRGLYDGGVTIQARF